MPSSPRLRLAFLVAAMLVLGLLTAGATNAQAPGPSSKYPVGSPSMLRAQQIARAYWGTDPCGGQVTVTWGRLAPSINAVSSWTSLGDPYADPGDNADCAIELNTAALFDWAKFCTVVVHEYGHLAGNAHDAEAGQLMSAVYEQPLPVCAPTRKGRRDAAMGRPGSLRRVG